jgi:Flp pilus assembly protein TadB
VEAGIYFLARASPGNRAEPFLKQNVRLFMSHTDKDQPEIVSTTEARSGVTGHNVRYVLAFGLAGVIIAFVLLLFAQS